MVPNLFINLVALAILCEWFFGNGSNFLSFTSLKMCMVLKTLKAVFFG